MHGLHRLILAAIVSFAWLAPGLTRGQSGESVAEMRAKLEGYFQQIERDHAAREQAWRQDYTRALTIVKQRIQSAGRLDDTIALTDEMARFERELSLPESAIRQSPEELAAVQREFATRLADIRIEKNNQVLALGENYGNYLTELMRRRTAAGDIEGATLAQDERDRAASLPEFTAAEFEIAALEARRNSRREPVPETEPTPEVAPDSSTSESPAEGPPRPLPAGVKVYRGPQRPPALSSYKRTSLSRTSHSPLGGGLLVDASVAETKKSIKHSSFNYEDHAEWTLRLDLRISPAFAPIETPLVVVQLFVKKPGQGRVDPIQARLVRVSLATIDPTSTTIELPALTVTSTRVRQGSYDWQYSGQEIYGALVSVFDADYALVYQGATVRGLNDVARPDLPQRSELERLDTLRQRVDEAKAALDEAWRVYAESDGNEALRLDYERANLVYQHARTAYQHLQEQIRRQGRP